MDLGTNALMQSIIIFVQIQCVDFKTIGFQHSTFTDNLYTIEAFTEEQLISLLYSCNIKNEEEIKTKMQKSTHELDEAWLKERKKTSKSKKKNIENEPENFQGKILKMKVMKRLWTLIVRMNQKQKILRMKV